MAKNSVRRIVAIVLCLVAVALIVTGIYGANLSRGERAEDVLTVMRTRSLLAASGEGAVESFVNAAKKQAAADAKAAGKSLAELREASAKAEEEARANSSASLIDYATVDTKPLDDALLILRSAMKDYTEEKQLAQELYSARVAGQLAAIGADPEATAMPTTPDGVLVLDEATVPSAEGGESAGMGDLALTTDEPQIDLSGFQDTDEMKRLMGIVDEKFIAVADALKVVYPVLDDSAIAQFKPMILDLTHQAGDTYDKEYDRYSQNGGDEALGNAKMPATIARYGSDLITIGIALILLALMINFFPQIVRVVGLPCLIISSFFILLCVLAIVYDLSITQLLSNAIVRMGMNSVMVLAMVPGIQCGISLNLGLPVGIIGGLIGGLMCIEYGYTGWGGFAFALAIGLAIATILGYLYGLLLNRLKGNEMSVTTYVGFSIVSLMCIAWLVLPFKSLELKWPLGNGLRNTVSMGTTFAHVLDDFWSFRVGGITVPTGLLLFVALMCLLMWLFTKTKTGIAMQAVGNNPRFAEATGINVDKMRIIGTTLSTVLGAVGIIVFSQSYGFMQLYTAPRTLGLIAASAILIGGASTSRARISHVIIGTFLFQGVLTLGMPVANALVPGSTIAETIRILVSNGIILYALTKSGGGSRA